MNKQENLNNLLLWSSILVERIGRIQILVTETQAELGLVASLLVARNRQLGTNIVHLELADGEDIALEIVVAQILHQLLYKSNSAPCSYFSCQPGYTSVSLR